MKSEDGGPVHPFPESFGGPWSSGMSLRDWLAGQWLVGSGRLFPLENKESQVFIDLVVEEAYRVADAMLAERERGRG